MIRPTTDRHVTDHNSTLPEKSQRRPDGPQRRLWIGHKVTPAPRAAFLGGEFAKKSEMLIFSGKSEITGKRHPVTKSYKAATPGT